VSHNLPPLELNRRQHAVPRVLALRVIEHLDVIEHILRGEMRKIKPRDFSDAMMREGQRRAANLTYLQRPATKYTTPALDAANRAAEGRSTPAREYSPEEERRSAAPVVQIPVRGARRPPAQDQVGDFRRAVGFEAALREGRSIPEKDAARLQWYRTHPDYKAGMMIFKQAGQAMFG